MDILKNKTYEHYSYISRYSDVPQYFNTVDSREMPGLGTNMLKDNTYVIHKIQLADTLDYLALKYYNNPTYWWVIAYFNDIIDSFGELHLKYTELKIPSITGIEFGEER